jgi:hypothetical protein
MHARMHTHTISYIYIFRRLNREGKSDRGAILMVMMAMMVIMVTAMMTCDKVFLMETAMKVMMKCLRTGRGKIFPGCQG